MDETQQTRRTARGLIPIPYLSHTDRVQALTAREAGIGPYAQHYIKWLPLGRQEERHADAKGQDAGMCDCPIKSKKG